MNVDLSRRVRIERNTPTVDATYGTPADGWAVLATVWAEMREVPPSRSEAVKNGLQVARNQTRCRIRYLDGLTSADRVIWDGVTYNIVGGPSELGRREYLELVLERYSSSGGT